MSLFLTDLLFLQGDISVRLCISSSLSRDVLVLTPVFNKTAFKRALYKTPIQLRLQFLCGYSELARGHPASHILQPVNAAPAHRMRSKASNPKMRQYGTFTEASVSAARQESVLTVQ
jgi:hypothetical protein